MFKIYPIGAQIDSEFYIEHNVKTQAAAINKAKRLDCGDCRIDEMINDEPWTIAFVWENGQVRKMQLPTEIKELRKQQQ